MKLANAHCLLFEPLSISIKHLCSAFEIYIKITFFSRFVGGVIFIKYYSKIFRNNSTLIMKLLYRHIDIQDDFYKYILTNDVFHKIFHCQYKDFYIE